MIKIVIIILLVLFQYPASRSFNTTDKPHGIWTVDWNADGKYIALGGDDSTLRIYDGKDFHLRQKYKLNP
jgi:WD40 repeat protein